MYNIHPRHRSESSKRLRKLIEDFGKEYVAFSKPEYASGNCLSISKQFIEKAEELGFEDVSIPGVFVDDSNTIHRIARVGDVCIDWTAKQYNTDAPFPLVFRDGVSGYIYKRPLYPVSIVY